MLESRRRITKVENQNRIVVISNINPIDLNTFYMCALLQGDVVISPFNTCYRMIINGVISYFCFDHHLSLYKLSQCDVQKQIQSFRY